MIYIYIYNVIYTIDIEYVIYTDLSRYDIYVIYRGAEKKIDVRDVATVSQPTQ